MRLSAGFLVKDQSPGKTCLAVHKPRGIPICSLLEYDGPYQSKFEQVGFAKISDPSMASKFSLLMCAAWNPGLRYHLLV